MRRLLPTLALLGGTVLLLLGGTAQVVIGLIALGYAWFTLVMLQVSHAVMARALVSLGPDKIRQGLRETR